jgi:hypothetical protein
MGTQSRAKRLPEAEDEPTISIPEAGAVFGLSRAASYQAARRGEIPTIAMGHRKLVPTAKLRAMLGLDAGQAS